MLKLVSAIVCIFLISVQAIHADWKEAVRGGWDSTVDATKDGWDSTIDATKDGWDAAVDATKGAVGKGTNESPDENIEISRKRALELWDDIQDIFDDILELKLERNAAPSSSIFVSTKADYDEKIERILGNVARLMNDQEISENRVTIAALKNKISFANEKISNLNAKAVLASGGDKLELQEDASDYEKDIEEYEESQLDLILQVKERLSEYGLDLSRDQVEVLLSRVDADDIVGMATIFAVISELTQQFLDATVASGENLSVAKKYYGMHVILLELQMHIQRSYIDRLRNVYIANADKIREQNEVLIDKTSDLMMDSKGVYRKIYENNLKTQRYTLNVLDLYERILRSDLLKIEHALQKISDNYKVALNTFETVTVSADLASMMAENRSLFSEVMSLQVPELIPFENLQMQREFEALSLQMGNM